MDFPISCTKGRGWNRALPMPRARMGFTLPEFLISTGLAVLCLAAIIGVFAFYTRSSHAMFNYADLSCANQIAMDYLTRDIREAIRITACTGTSLTVLDADNTPLTYEYDPVRRTFMRTKNGVSKLLLTECDRLKFDLGERNPVGGSYEVFPATTNIAVAKVVDVSWLCSRKILGVTQNTESVQTARIVVRKQGT